MDGLRREACAGGREQNGLFGGRMTLTEADRPLRLLVCLPEWASAAGAASATDTCGPRRQRRAVVVIRTVGGPIIVVRARRFLREAWVLLCPYLSKD